MSVVLVDAGGTNIGSVRYALQRLGVDAALTSDATQIRAADKVILPGVGAAGFASLNAGYHHAFAAAASINVLAAILSAFVLRLPSSKLPSANLLRTTK